MSKLSSSQSCNLPLTNPSLKGSANDLFPTTVPNTFGVPRAVSEGGCCVEFLEQSGKCAHRPIHPPTHSHSHSYSYTPSRGSFIAITQRQDVPFMVYAQDMSSSDPVSASADVNLFLRHVVAYVDVHGDDEVKTSAALAAQLEKMGATVQKTYTKQVTHVIFEGGNRKLIDRLQALPALRAPAIVSPLWVDECAATNTKAHEYDFVVDSIAPTTKSFQEQLDSIHLVIGKLNNTVTKHESTITELRHTNTEQQDIITDLRQTNTEHHHKFNQLQQFTNEQQHINTELRQTLVEHQATITKQQSTITEHQSTITKQQSTITDLHNWKLDVQQREARVALRRTLADLLVIACRVLPNVPDTFVNDDGTNSQGSMHMIVCNSEVALQTMEFIYKHLIPKSQARQALLTLVQQTADTGYPRGKVKLEQWMERSFHLLVNWLRLMGLPLCVEEADRALVFISELYRQRLYRHEEAHAFPMMSDWWNPQVRAHLLHKLDGAHQQLGSMDHENPLQLYHQQLEQYVTAIQNVIQKTFELCASKGTECGIINTTLIDASMAEAAGTLDQIVVGHAN